MSREQSLLAVDVGSGSVKLGWFPAGETCSTAASVPSAAMQSLPITSSKLPIPAATLRCEHRGRDEAQWLRDIEDWLAQQDGSTEAQIAIASVHPAAADILAGRFSMMRSPVMCRLKAGDLQLTIRVELPTRVGIDRLLGAMAVNAVRRADRAAIFVDMGTATTVNLVAADGAFEGGAILAGPQLALAALHDATASLPLVDLRGDHDFPLAAGKSTVAALRSGALWGAVGAVNELMAQMARTLSEPPELFLTGGGAALVAERIQLSSQAARWVPALVLSGIRLAAK